MIDELGRGIRTGGSYTFEPLTPPLGGPDHRRQLRALQAGFETVDMVLDAAGIAPERAYRAHRMGEDGPDPVGAAVWAHAEIEASVRIDTLLGCEATANARLHWWPRTA